MQKLYLPDQRIKMYHAIIPIKQQQQNKAI